MPEQAQVRSIEAIATFRSSLIIYLTKARAVLEEVNEEKQRTRVWLENDRRSYWEQECRRRAAQLQEAQQALITAKLSRIFAATAAQALAVERAERSLEQAKSKRDAVKRWIREFESRVEPLARLVEQLQTFLAMDLTKAVAQLSQVLSALDAYTQTRRGGSDSERLNAAEAGPAVEPILLGLMRGSRGGGEENHSR